MDKKILKEAIKNVLLEKGELGKFTKKTAKSVWTGLKLTRSWLPKTEMEHGKEKAVLHELLKKYPPLNNECAVKLGKGIERVSNVIKSKGDNLDAAFDGVLWALGEIKRLGADAHEHHKVVNFDVCYLTKMKNGLIGYVHAFFHFKQETAYYELSATFSKENPKYAEEVFEKRFEDDVYNGYYIKLKIK